MSTISGVTHSHIQTVKKLPIVITDQAAGILSVTAAPTVGSVSKPQLGASTSSNDENVNEAFAKLKVALTNLDAQSTQSAISDTGAVQGADSAGSTIASSAGASGSAEKTAAQDFKDYMDMPVSEKVRAGMLADMGITEDEYAAMSPAQQAGIDKKIEEKMRQEQEAKAADTATDGVSATLPSTLTASLSGQDGTGSNTDAQREKRTEELKSLS